eukprot:NODE_60_length_27201_cov_1.043318.p2 type:complete len:755 gc:universal NODE_60_length_27201_cov_1.043318:19201-21465(+)
MVRGELQEIYQGTVHDVCADNGKLYLQTDEGVSVINKDGDLVEELQIQADYFKVLEGVIYHIRESVLYRDRTKIANCTDFQALSNLLKQHIIYAYEQPILQKITINNSLNQLKEEFEISLLDYYVTSDEKLLIQTQKHLGLYQYGHSQPYLIINDYVLSLPLLGGYKHHYIFDSTQYLYICRYKGGVVYKGRDPIATINFTSPANGILLGGFLYSLEQGNLSIFHCFTRESTNIKIQGNLLKTSEGAFIYDGKSIFKIVLKDFSDIQRTLCDANLHPMALDLLKSNQHELDIQTYSTIIKKQFIHFLIDEKKYDQSCLLMTEIQYPLRDFVRHFPEVVPKTFVMEGVKISSDNDIKASVIHPFLPYLSSLRSKFVEVDTILFYIYSKINVGLLESLIRVENNCDLDVCGSILLEKSMIDIWIKFYFSKEKHQEAIDIMIEKDFESKHFIKYFDMLLEKGLTDWLFQYAAPWFLKSKRNFSFFVSHPKLQKDKYKLKILEILEFDHRLQREYLQDLVFQFKADSVYHTKLMLIQIEIISDLLNSGLSLEDDKIMQERLLFREFLTTSKKYDGNALVSQLNTLNLDFETALVYKSLKRHIEALKIYVLKMQNHVEAENYCFDVYYDSDDKNIFKLLFHIYFEYDSKSLAAFSDKYVDYLDPIDCLQHLSINLRLAEITHYVDKSNRSKMKDYQRSGLRKNQLKVQHSRLRQERYFELSQSCTIDAYKVCFNCNRRIGDKACYIYQGNLCCANCVTE